MGDYMMEEIISFMFGVITGIIAEYLYFRNKSKKLITQATVEEKKE
jgi:hypothetical protein